MQSQTRIDIGSFLSERPDFSRKIIVLQHIFQQLLGLYFLVYGTFQLKASGEKVDFILGVITVFCGAVLVLLFIVRPLLIKFTNGQFLGFSDTYLEIKPKIFQLSQLYSWQEISQLELDYGKITIHHKDEFKKPQTVKIPFHKNYKIHSEISKIAEIKGIQINKIL